jgi:hypothetical protein
MFFRMLVLVSIGLVGCGGSPTTPIGPVDERVVLAPGERADLTEEAGISIRFVGVFGDSRCPADAICIQGGDAIVRIEVLAQGSSTYELHTGDMQPVRHADLTIELENLSPYPFSSRTIEPGEYRATLHITRA